MAVGGLSIAHSSSMWHVVVVGEIEGQKGAFKCEGIWTYSVDEEGKLTSMLGYSEADGMKEALTELPNHQYYVE
jgi:hypothetical protein